MKKSLFLAALAAALGTLQAEALDLMLKNGQTLPNVTIVNTMKRTVTLVTTDAEGNSVLRKVPFSELTDSSLSALKQYFMENINSYMEPARPSGMQNLNSLRDLSTFDPATQTLTMNSGGILFTAAPTATFSLRPVSPNRVTAPPPQQPGSGSSNIILPTYPHNISFLSLGMITSGSLGIATSAPSDNADGPLVNHYGRIYIYGVNVPQNAEWTGIIYPTGKTIFFNGVSYPCYATTQATAKQIAASNQ